MSSEKTGEKSKCDVKKTKRFTSKPFRDKKFYLNLKSYGGVKNLTENIKLLGGIVEPFFSNEVDCVVTNHKEPKNDSVVSDSYMQSNPNVSGNGNAAQKDNDKKKTMDRGKVMAEKGKEKLQMSNRNGTSNVLENAERWNIRVVDLNRFIEVIETYKRKIEIWKSRILEDDTAQNRRNKISLTLDSHNARKLREPFLKLEPIARTLSPLFVEFQEWPKPYWLGKEYFRDTNTSSKQSKKKLEETSHRKKKCRYCELCSKPYQEMQEHIMSEEHLQKVSNNEVYAKYDEIVNETCSMEAYFDHLADECISSDSVELITPYLPSVGVCEAPNSASTYILTNSNTLPQMLPINESYLPVNLTGMDAFMGPSGTPKNLKRSLSFGLDADNESNQSSRKKSRIYINSTVGSYLQMSVEDYGTYECDNELKKNLAAEEKVSPVQSTNFNITLVSECTENETEVLSDKPLDLSKSNLKFECKRDFKSPRCGDQTEAANCKQLLSLMDICGKVCLENNIL